MGFFVKKDVSYNLLTKELCKLPSVSSQRYGIDSRSFRVSLLWNTLSDDLKLTTSLVIFKKKYVAVMATTTRATFALILGFLHTLSHCILHIVDGWCVAVTYK